LAACDTFPNWYGTVAHPTPLKQPKRTINRNAWYSAICELELRVAEDGIR
jgi:hypothetical protein